MAGKKRKATIAASKSEIESATALKVNKVCKTQNPVIHSGPFICEEEGCGKTFNQKYALKTHSLIHNIVNRFECNFPLCGKVFNNRGLTLDHIKSHLDKKKLESEHFDNDVIDNNYDPLYFLLVDGIQAKIDCELSENKEIVTANPSEQKKLFQELAHLRKVASSKVKRFRKEHLEQMEKKVNRKKEQCKTNTENYKARVRSEAEKSIEEIKLKYGMELSDNE
ncbi:Transcription factor IIIA [Tyrophagus putrescentiae]|nr:Transcription factor IIIA [Tyrophagus putrescentiae]KAH9402290.1 Transcription factor IIIA [Tyrophagus putrescentiae]